VAKTKELPVGDPREFGFVPGRLDRIGRTIVIVSRSKIVISRRAGSMPAGDGAHARRALADVVPRVGRHRLRARRYALQRSHAAVTGFVCEYIRKRLSIASFAGRA
jgi:hypothetical protein